MVCLFHLYAAVLQLLGVMCTKAVALLGTSIAGIILKTSSVEGFFPKHIAAPQAI